MKRDQCSLERGADPLEDRKAARGDLGRALEVDDPEVGSEVPVGLWTRSRRSAASRRALDPVGPLVGADGNAVVEEVGQRQLELRELRFEILGPALEPLDLLTESGHLGSSSPLLRRRGPSR